MSKPSSIAMRYVSALFSCAKNKTESKAIYKGLKSFVEAMKDNKDLDLLIHSPVFSAGEKTKAITALAKKAKMHQSLTNFLLVLAQNGRLHLLKDIAKGSDRIMNDLEGRFEAEVTTSAALSAKDVESLQKVLSKKLDKDVTLNASVDESLLGGMVVRAGSIMIDDSVRTKLNIMKRDLRNTQTLDSSLTQNLKEA